MLKTCTLALPNGSLEEKTIALFAAAGWSITREGRKALCETDCPFGEQAFFTRPQAIPRIVASGICDIGICGQDCVAEVQHSGPDNGQSSLVELLVLPYSKGTNGPTTVALVTRESNRERPEEIPYGKEVYSELFNFTRHFFRTALPRRDLRIVRSPGSTEGHVAIGEYEYGVCIVEQGRTLAQNNLRVMAALLVSRTVVIARRDNAESARPFAEALLNALQKEDAR